MKISSSPLRPACPSRPPFRSTLLSPSRPRRIPFSRARTQGALSACQALLPDLRAGAFLRQLHALQNDQFGLPAQVRAALFRWQEVFMGLLDAATALAILVDLDPEAAEDSEVPVAACRTSPRNLPAGQVSMKRSAGVCRSGAANDSA
ncbi:hypothetical protein POSPLADRAFT_1060596 [Postia placenta MAD-698-R-SB12]|uniref:Uncharacterized protein n=1 Tax=Postia placenta MAD-698-R-SB12 TaxID=670580 RepID=A0A1X6MR57_9APHY|nr:hypothetical protein POSPLADRAFT_1060596 [Postia placenta MAD-698-R-SB12]OSX58706.1 hypothetical protein POSPLADRAFT_1060596 [Postia placenta MAD-698-R-SB12]